MYLLFHYDSHKGIKVKKMKKNLRIWAILLIFLNGYVSLSLELVVLRNLSVYVGSSAVITSIIMGIFLGFMSLGYFMGTASKITGGKIRNVLSRSFLTIALLAFFAASFPMITLYFGIMYASGITSNIIQTFIYSLLLLSMGPFLFGFNTTLLSRLLHKHNTNYTGNIMAWDTIGSVLGSLATTLLLMPFMGVNYTVILVVLLACVAAIITRPKLWVCFTSVLILGATVYLNSNWYQQKQMGILVNNANSTISISEFQNERVLNMNGLPMSVYNTDSGQVAQYVEYINNVYLYTIPKDRVHKILVLGAGGFTVGLDDNFNEYTFVDIEHTLRDVAEQKFLEQKLGDNKKFIVQDASQFLKNTPEQYDVIVLDVYSNSFQIPEGFITAEFMQRIKSSVAENGVIIMNVITSHGFHDKFSQVFDNTFHSVFQYNTSRQVIFQTSPWVTEDVVNVLYIWFNRENDGRIYTVNKTPVIYDR